MNASSGAADWVGALIVLALAVLFPLWGAVDAAIRPRAAWDQAHRDKTLWVAVLLVALVVGLGVLATIAYIVRVRPRLVKAQRGRRGSMRHR